MTARRSSTPTTSPAGRRAPVAAALTTLSLAAFAAITAEVLPVGLLPAISRDLHTTEPGVGLLVSAYAVVVAAGSLPLTALATRWPRRSALIVVLITYAVGNGVFASTGSYAVALVARLLAGLAHATFFSLAIGAATALVPPERSARAVAWVSAGNALALAAGIPAGTALGAAVGWRWAFAAIAAVLLLLAGAAAAVLPAPAPAVGPAHLAVHAAARQRPLVIVATTTAVATLGHYTAFTYINPLIARAGIGEDSVSLVLLGYGLSGVLGLLIAGAVGDRHPRTTLLAVVAGLSAALVGLALVGRSPVPTVAAVLVWGSAFGALPTLLQIAALRASPGAPDAAPAVVNATFNVGIAGGGVLGARELHVAGPSVLALTGGLLAAVALVLVVVTPALTARPRDELPTTE